MKSAKSLELKQLNLRQLDARLEPWKAVRDLPSPRTGWIATVRQALGMGVKHLAQRLGVDPAAVIRLERREAAGKVTLETLHRAAEALDSKLVYAVVPKEDLQSMLLAQARRVAEARLRRVGHTMGLEAQGVDSEEVARMTADLTMQLLREWPRSLWDDPDADGQANG